MTWSRRREYEALLQSIAERDAHLAREHDQLERERAAHQRTRDQLAAEVAHSGRVHADLVALQECGENTPRVQALTERLHRFTEKSVDVTFAVADALTEHAKHHDCVRRDEPKPAPAAAAPAPKGPGRW